MTRSIRLILSATVTLSLTHILAQAPPRDARITGTVLCADTHLPARGALVSVQALPSTDRDTVPSDAGGSAMTASDGTYTIGNLPSGSYVVIAVLPGYLTELHQILQASVKTLSAQTHDIEPYRTAMSHQQRVWVGDGQTMRFDILLQRGAALSGHIRYPDGAPASQVTLILEEGTHPSPNDNNSRMKQNILANVESQFTNQLLRPDDRGAFRLFGLQPGKYRLAVLQPSNHPRTSRGDGVQITGDQRGVSVDPSATRFYAGDTTHSTTATVFDLHPGEEISDITITLPLHAFHAVQGSVHSTDGRIPSGTSLRLVDTTDPTTAFYANAREDGTFSFLQVPVGSYQLTCALATISHSIPRGGGEAEVYTAAFAAQTLPVNVGSEDVNGVDFALHEIPLTDELKYINSMSQQQ